MRFSLASSVGPFDASGLVSLARRLQFDGITLSAGAERLLDDPQLLEQVQANGLVVAMITAPAVVDAVGVRQAIDRAQVLRCQQVAIDLTSARLDASLDALLPLVDYAAERGVALLVLNSSRFRAARAMWLLLEQVNHPALQTAFRFASAGESPVVSIPTLNSRIAHVLLDDASENGGACPLGTGVIPLEKAVLRLRGIGYKGWLTIGPQGVGADALEAVLEKSLGTARAWVKPPEPAKPAKPEHKKPAPAKPAAAAPAVG